MAYYVTFPHLTHVKLHRVKRNGRLLPSGSGLPLAGFSFLRLHIYLDFRLLRIQGRKQKNVCRETGND
jgi:hypothetical protein